MLPEAAKACRDSALGRAVLKACDHAVHRREEALSRLADPKGARQAASNTRAHSLEAMDGLLERLTERLKERGVHVFRAADREQASRYVVELAADRGVSSVVKSKSMTGEEAGLAAALEAAGCRVVETDLGEYIVQLRNEPPSHINAPALHVSRQQVGELFAGKLGMDPTADPAEMCAFARHRLRNEFLTADLGIVGVNLAIAATGDLVTVTNEGNGRLCESIPRVLVAFTGIEKVVEGLDDAAAVLRVLSKNATGQAATTYVSLLRGPAGPEEPFGPREIHLVLMDNGRSRLRQDPDLRDMLKCIRCGACINSCPVYRSIGGHAYGATYVGPMGITLTHGMAGIAEAGDMSYACTLCGECGQVCPVHIDLPEMILKLRTRVPKAPGRRLAMKAGRFVLSGPVRFSLAGRLAGGTGRFAPVLFSKMARLWGWTGPVPAPVVSRVPFRRLWKKWSPSQLDSSLMVRLASKGDSLQDQTPAPHPPDDLSSFISRFQEEHGELLRGTWTTALGYILESIDSNMLLADKKIREFIRDPAQILLDPTDLHLTVKEAGDTLVGVTSCLALVAETGSILLAHGGGNERVASLLPDIHIVLAHPDQVVASCEEAMAIRDRLDSPAATLVTGPSRTADIEKILILGMHGPRRLILVLSDS